MTSARRATTYVDAFTEVPPRFEVQVFLESLLRVRRDLAVDPMAAEAWSCDPERCRPLLGRNLCCKVQRKCRHFQDDRCGVHTAKPFDCALFPLDLIRVAGVRVVTTVKNPQFYATGWCRFDRDMLRCFDGEEQGTTSMFEVQREILLGVFTVAETTLMARTLARHCLGP